MPFFVWNNCAATLATWRVQMKSTTRLVLAALSISYLTATATAADYLINGSVSAIIKASPSMKDRIVMICR